MTHSAFGCFFDLFHKRKYNNKNKEERNKMIRIKKKNALYGCGVSFKYLLDVFWPVLPRDIFRNLTKSLWWSNFCNPSNNFPPLTIFAKKIHHKCSSGF